MDRRSFYRAIVLLAAVCVGRGAAAESPVDEFTVAAGHYQAQRWDLAAEGFESFRRSFPDHALVHDAAFYEAEARAQLGQFAEAAAQLDGLIASGNAGKRLQRAMFRRGETAYLARDYEKAKGYLEAYWKEYPEDELLAYILAYLGDVHVAAGEQADAEAAYRACLEHAPQGPLALSCRSGLARILIARGNLEEAQNLLAFLAESDDRAIAGQALLELARLAFRRGDFDVVKKHCKTLVTRDAESGDAARLLFAEALYRLGELPAADEQFRHLYESSDERMRERALYGRIRLAVDRQDHDAFDRLAEEFLNVFGESSLAVIVQVAAGESRVVRREFETAQAFFTAALAAQPDDRIAAQCRAGMAVCLVAGGELDEATAQLSILTDNHGQHWDVPATTYRVAELAYSGGFRDEAAELFQEVAEATSSPDLAARALAGLAWARLKQEDLLGSAEAFEQLIEKYPSDPRAADAGLLRAQILQRRGELDAALAMYRRVIDELADGDVLPRAIYLAARLHDRLKQLGEARSLYERLIAEFPDHEHVAAARYHLGWVLRESGEPQAALDSWKAVHEGGGGTPHWREATYLLAEHAIDGGDKDLARSLVTSLTGDFADGGEASDENPSDSHGEGERLYARSLLLAAHLAMEEDDWAEAQGHLARIVADCPADPLHATAHFWLAEAEYRLAHFDAAYEALQQLASVAAGRDDEWVPFVPLRLAQILAHRKQWSEAMAAAEKVLDDYPAFPLRHEADYVLGRCLAARGEFDASREAYERVIDSETGRNTETAAMAQWMIGESYMHQRDYDSALRAYLRGEILFPYARWQAASLLQAGKCYELLSDWGRAEAMYRRLVDRFPDESLTEEARSRLTTVTRHAAARP